MTWTGGDGRAEFSLLIEAIRPSLSTTLMIGGWAHRLHRLSPKARAVTYDPVFTYDADVVVTTDHSNREADLKSALANKGFTEQFSGEARPPVTHYQLGTETNGFYAEFLTPLIGGTHRRDGTPDVTAKVRGVNAQKLRYLDLLLIEPWTIEIGLRAPRHRDHLFHRIVITHSTAS